MVMSTAASPVVIANQPLKRYTRKEYDQLIELGAFQRQRIELVFGQLIQMSPIGMPHVTAVQRLMEFLVVQLHGRAQVFCQSPFAASDDSEPEPDLFVTDSAPGGRRTDPITHVRLIVETSESSLAYDRGEKALLYALAEVDEYWVVDLVHGHLEVRRDRRDGVWTSITTHRPGETVALLAYPDVVVRVDDLV